MPQLREQYGAYGVQHSASEDGVLTLSFMDPNIKETFDVYTAMGDAIDTMPLDQQTLDGYILSAYSHYTQSLGELSGALNAMLGLLDGRPQELFITWMKELKALTPEKVKAYADMYRAMSEQGYVSTAGGAAAIEQNSDRYDVVLNPFKVKDTPLTLSDLSEDRWYHDAVRYALDNKVMRPLDEQTFGAEEPGTVGDLVDALMAMMQAPVTADQGIAILAQMGMLTGSEQPSDPMTREWLTGHMFRFLAGVMGDAVKGNLPPLPDAPDAQDISPEYLDGMRFAAANGLLHMEDDRLAPQQPATRADIALYMWGLEQME